MKLLIVALLLVGCATTEELVRAERIKCLENESECLQVCRYSDDPGTKECIRSCSDEGQKCVDRAGR